MRPQLQRYRDRFDGHFGDCHRTCIAMLLNMDRDDVPHFMEDCPPGEGAESPASIAAQQAEFDWLEQHGIAPVYIPFMPDMSLDVLTEQMGRFARNAPVILGCSVGGVVNHSVVLYEGKIHDPLLRDGDEPPAYQPAIEGYWWITVYSVHNNWMPRRASRERAFKAGFHAGCSTCNMPFEGEADKAYKEFLEGRS